MERALRYKTIFLVFLILLSGVYLTPSVVGEERLPTAIGRVFSKKVKLGLDLQGGLHIVYGVDLDKVIDDKAGETKRDIEAKAADLKINVTVDAPRPSPEAGVPLGAVVIRPKTPEDAKKIDSKFLEDYDEVLEKMTCPAAVGGANAICLRVRSGFGDKIKTSALEQAITTIKDRVD